MESLLSSIISLDYGVVHAAHALRTPLGTDIALYISELAAVSTAIGAALILSIVFAYYRNWRFLAGMLFALGGTYGIVNAMKLFFERARPEAPYFAYIEPSASFPSGHSAEAAALYLLIGYFSLWFVPPGTWRYEMGLLLSLIVLAVGMSRVYLGVHFPSDVLAGWVIGTCVTLLAIRYMERA